MLIYLAIFAFAALTDVVSVAWNAARERAHPWRAGLLSMALEGAAYLPLIVAYQTEDPGVIVASVLGSGLGSFLAVKRLDTRSVSAVPSSGGRADVADR